MGVTTRLGRLRMVGWLGRVPVLHGFALASVIVNVVIVVTGGAVRLTGSGLGCPTWPRCDSTSLTPTHANAVHGIIEFTNRQLTFVVTVVVALTFLAALAAGRQRRLAGVLLAGIPAQAVLGGITVLTHLNPWAVAAHFLLSMAVIAMAFAVWRASRPGAGGVPQAPPRQRRLVELAARLLVLLTALVLAAGTVVTGTGPHAGDKGATNRIHLSPASMSQLHADLVMLLIGVTVGFVVLTRAVATTDALRRGAGWLLAIELAQGVIGFVQYFTHVPAVLVGVHMFGACLVWLAALMVLARCRDVRAESSAEAAAGAPSATRPSAGVPPAGPAAPRPARPTAPPDPGRADPGRADPGRADPQRPEPGRSAPPARLR